MIAVVMVGLSFFVGGFSVGVLFVCAVLFLIARRRSSY